MDDIAALAQTANQDITPRIVKLEKENQVLRNSTYIMTITVLWYMQVLGFCLKKFSINNHQQLIKKTSNVIL